ncbi:MAG: NAD(P)-dependent dehydrogenase (short-subunit alcohol dehydrogenase family) [Pirellulaceae bacterium]|jgi:NAD(P)-dependent dehydrogenase (short-subunit alcohol dehydrogenase family)
MQWNLADKHVLVTGGGGGIGAAIAAAFSDQGCQVIATGLHQGEVDGIRQLNSNIRADVLDVSSDQSVANLIGSLDELDVLVNCAGIIARGAEFDMDAFQRVVDVNLHGTMRMCTGCQPLLAKRGGCIVNIASMLTYFGSAFAPAYSASKGGVGQLTKSLAIAWASEDIRVNAVAPGWIKTELTRPLYESDERSAGLLERTPMGRWGESTDVAGTVLFLASSAAKFITGAIIPVDGGYSAS